VTYRSAPCHHCGTRSAASRCRDCDQHVCELCAIEGRCPSCWRAKLAASAAPRRQRWLARALLAVAAVTVVGLGWGAAQARQHRRAAAATAARAQLHTVQYALAGYTLEHDDCPDVLAALYGRSYLDRHLLHDPWGEPLDYQCLRRQGGRGIRLSSSGPDRHRDTPDDLRLDHEIRW